jgi:nucleoporin NUP82
MAYPAAAMPGRSAFPHSPDPFAPDVAWLDGLAQHPIFHAGDTPPAPAAGRSSVRARSTLALRGTDLVAAVGSELRIASLAEAKHAAATGASPAERPHRVLAHALPPFPIASIAVNPANRLLAVVGSHQVAVLVLPRSAGSKAQADAAHSRGAARSVTCHAARVGAYYHDEHIGPHARVAKVLWHPWGKDGTSLLILTADGTLR